MPRRPPPQQRWREGFWGGEWRRWEPGGEESDGGEDGSGEGWQSLLDSL